MNRTLNVRSWALGISLTASLLVSTVAQAHIALADSSPAADAVVSSVTRIDLVFSERLVRRASKVQLEAIGEGRQANVAASHVNVEVVNNGTTLRVTPHHTLDAGRYRVRWRAVGEDGHPLTGDFIFTIE
jgi:methionine-rich copper-binding protein CopC